MTPESFRWSRDRRGRAPCPASTPSDPKGLRAGRNRTFISFRRSISGRRGPRATGCRARGAFSGAAPSGCRARGTVPNAVDSGCMWRATFSSTVRLGRRGRGTVPNAVDSGMYVESDLLQDRPARTSRERDRTRGGQPADACGERPSPDGKTRHVRARHARPGVPAPVTASGRDPSPPARPRRPPSASVAPRSRRPRRPAAARPRAGASGSRARAGRR